MSTTPCPKRSGPRPMPSRLIIDQPAFLQVAPLLLVENDHLTAVGRVRRRTTGSVQEYILDRWEIQRRIPDGRQRPPMLDWAVLAAARRDLTNVKALIEHLQPKRSQMVIAILLSPSDHSQFTTAIWHDEQWSYPDEVRLIGPGMLVLGESSDLYGGEFDDEAARPLDAVRESDAAVPNDVELRASRTSGALKSLYPRLRNMHAVLVGAGGGGQELARQLIASGLRRMTVIDGDILGPENLDRMPLAEPADIGQPKTVQLARALHRNQPGLVVHAVGCSVHQADAVRRMHGMRADVIFSFLDSDVGRLATALLAKEMHAVHVDVGTLIRWEGELKDATRVMAADVRLFAPGRGCVACVPEMDGLEAVLYHLASPTNCLNRGQPQAWDTLRAGSLLHLNSTAAALAIETWFAWLEGEIANSTWTRLRWEGLVPRVETAAVGPAENCRFCAASE